MLELKSVKIKKPDDVNVILGQSHFIKTAEDLYEALTSSVPGIKFGLGFVESSGACKVRSEGNDPELKKLAEENALEIGAGHSFTVFIKNAYPINVLNAIKAIPERKDVIAYDGNEIGTNYKSVSPPTSINGNLVYSATTNDDKEVIVYGNQEFGQEYDEVGFPTQVGNKLVFWAKKEGKQYIVMEK